MSLPFSGRFVTGSVSIFRVLLVVHWGDEGRTNEIARCANELSRCESDCSPCADDSRRRRDDVSPCTNDSPRCANAFPGCVHESTSRKNDHLRCENDLPRRDGELPRCTNDVLQRVDELLRAAIATSCPRGLSPHWKIVCPCTKVLTENETVALSEEAIAAGDTRDSETRPLAPENMESSDDGTVAVPAESITVQSM